VRENIPIRILCTRHPESAGTLIAKETGDCRNPVKSIAYKKPLQLLRLRTERRAAEEFIPAVLNAIGEAGSQALHLSACGLRLILTISPVSKSESLLEDLRKLGVPELVPDVASIALVGSGLRERVGTLEPLFRQIPAGQPHLFNYGSSPIACNFVVPEASSSETINRFHDHFFSRPDPDWFE